jgi:hypothetical protein
MALLAFGRLRFAKVFVTATTKRVIRRERLLYDLALQNATRHCTPFHFFLFCATLIDERLALARGPFVGRRLAEANTK